MRRWARSRSESARCSKSSRRCSRSQGLAPRRADDCARARARSSTCTASFSPGRPRASGSSMSAIGYRRCWRSPTASRCSATGRARARIDAAEISENGLVALMIGRPLQLAFPERERRRPVRGAAGRRRASRPRFGPLDLTLPKGEIVGLAGAEGNGQLELLRCLGGVDRATGTVAVSVRRSISRLPTQPSRPDRAAQRRPDPANRCSPCSACGAT